MSKSKPDFSSFGNAAKKTAVEKNQSLIVKPVGFKHLQVRLSAEDAKRFKRAAEDRGLSVQGGLVDAVNRLMIEWDESPVFDPGSAGKNT